MCPSQLEDIHRDHQEGGLALKEYLPWASHEAFTLFQTHNNPGKEDAIMSIPHEEADLKLTGVKQSIQVPSSWGEIRHCI